ncbi:uncharacterized protein LOC123257494 [Drosophila ananassae]|uniref:uncharacterized protein LOC123257494 n=1 Tax=Drosophila ananassae TaxID=7217 RepID=UPI001CFFBFF8|nr:uncharacterized protein LOC123257494 [Drosophila ananassae]
MAFAVPTRLPSTQFPSRKHHHHHQNSYKGANTERHKNYLFLLCQLDKFGAQRGAALHIAWHLQHQLQQQEQQSLQSKGYRCKRHLIFALLQTIPNGCLFGRMH